MTLIRPTSSNLFIAFGFLFLLACYLFLIWPGLYGPFLFDDFPNLQNLIQLNGSDWHIGKYVASFNGNPGRPISALSFLINDYAWPSDPFSFKYTNVFIHLLNAVLLFGFIRQLAKASPKLPQHAIWPLLAMIAWLFQPIHLSTQMLVVQRMTLLAGTFSIAGLWAYTVLLQQAKNWRGCFFAGAVLGAATLFAFLCKENGALLPLFALVLNATILAECLAKKDRISQRLVFIYCVIPSLCLLFLIIQMGFAPNAYFHREFNLNERLLTQTHVFYDYLKQILLPSLTGSGIYYDDYPISHSLFAPISTLLLAALWLVSIISAIKFRKQYVLPSFAVLWFFAGHLMESTVLPLEIYFEHRNYLPCIGITLLISALPFYVVNRQRLGFLILSVWLSALIAITALQAPIWGKRNFLVTFWIKEHPTSVRAIQELSKYYFENGDPQKSSDILINAYANGVHTSDFPLTALLLQCDFHFLKNNNNLLQLSMRSIEDSPFSNGSLLVLQELRWDVQTNTCPDRITADSWLQLSQAMLANPKFKRAGESFIRVERAKYFQHNKDLDNAMFELESTYRINPNIELSYKIAEVLLTAGLLEQSELWLKKGIALKQPRFKEMLYNDKEKSIALLKSIEQYNKQQFQLKPSTVQKEH